MRWRATRARLQRTAVGCAAALLVWTPACALDLAQAWRLALDSDPQLRAARAQTMADRERLPQARSRLLPVLSAQVARHRNQLQAEGPDTLGQSVSSDSSYTSRGEVLSLRQPLYRKAAWLQVQQAAHVVAAAEARLDAETQALLERLGKAYFETLLAQDQIDVIGQQTRAYAAQLGAARSSLSAGAGTRTDIDEAQARLDLAQAEALGLRQALDLARRELQALTGQPATDLALLDPVRLRVDPHTGDLVQLTQRAEDASAQMQALREQVQASRKDIDIARAGHHPTLDAVAQYSRSDSENVARLASTYRHWQVGVVLNIPLYQGGLVDSQVREAVARLERAEHQLEGLRRDLGVRVHREFRGVTEGVARIRALEQAVRSSEQLVTSNERSFAAGFRTRVDILNAQGQFAAARRDLAQARYLYLTSRLRLGALTGTAPDTLISEINSALRTP
ncbi:MAG: TolC family outer membrane protein [Pseudomonadota bacterium]